jgi:hypothetical protein
VISSGVFGLAGVLLGSAVTTVVQVHLERRRELREAHAETRALHAAKRQIRGELFGIGLAANQMLNHLDRAELWQPMLGEFEMWSRHSDLLANEDCYLPVQTVYMSARNISHIVSKELVKPQSLRRDLSRRASSHRHRRNLE